MKPTLIMLASSCAILAGWGIWAVADSHASYEIDPVGSAATLLVALIFGYFYSERVSQRSVDTELLRDIVKDAKAGLETLQAVAMETYLPAATLDKAESAKIFRHYRELSNTILLIEQAIGHCGYKAVDFQFSELKEERSKLYESLTKSPYPGPYDDAALTRIDTSFKDFREELTRIAFAINRRR
jgi:hypothetical protein